jgi:hypothetical protein
MKTQSLLRMEAFGAKNCADELDYKDVYFPDPGSDQDVLALATMGFRDAGYVVRQAQRIPCHRAYAFRLKAPPGPPIFVRHRDFQDHFRKILCGIGLPVPKDSLLLDRNGNRLLVAFLLQSPPTEQA